MKMYRIPDGRLINLESIIDINVTSCTYPDKVEAKVVATMGNPDATITGWYGDKASFTTQKIVLHTVSLPIQKYEKPERVYPKKPEELRPPSCYMNVPEINMEYYHSSQSRWEYNEPLVTNFFRLTYSLNFPVFYRGNRISRKSFSDFDYYRYRDCEEKIMSWISLAREFVMTEREFRLKLFDSLLENERNGGMDVTPDMVDREKLEKTVRSDLENLDRFEEDVKKYYDSIRKYELEYDQYLIDIRNYEQARRNNSYEYQKKCREASEEHRKMVESKKREALIEAQKFVDDFLEKYQ